MSKRIRAAVDATGGGGVGGERESGLSVTCKVSYVTDVVVMPSGIDCFRLAILTYISECISRRQLSFA